MVLKSMPYAQAKVYETTRGFILVSYVTTVAEIEDGWLTIYGLYSKTTRRHISAFVKEYCGMDYYTAKQLYYDGMKINLETGEVVKI